MDKKIAVTSLCMVFLVTFIPTLAFADTAETSLQDTEEAALPGDDIILDDIPLTTAEIVLRDLILINRANNYIQAGFSVVDSRRFDISYKSQSSQKMKELVDKYNRIFNEFLQSEDYETIGGLRKARKHREAMREEVVALVNEILKELNDSK